jgi:hypothetical protein
LLRIVLDKVDLIAIDGTLRAHAPDALPADKRARGG